MALTEFGKAVRIARVHTGDTLLAMSKALGVSSSFLSALETGSKNVSEEWVGKIKQYFDSKGYQFEAHELDELAAVSNKNVNIEGLSLQQQLLVAGFAKSPFTTEELGQFAELLQKIRTRSHTTMEKPQCNTALEEVE